MAKRKRKGDGPINGRAGAQKDYDTRRRGDSWFSYEQNVMDNRKDSRGADERGRARKMQFDDLANSMADEALKRLRQKDSSRKTASGKKDAKLRTKTKTNRKRTTGKR